MFNIIREINELKAVTKHISCEFKFDRRNVTQVKGRITIKVDMSVKKIMYVKRILFGNFLHAIVKVENIYQEL